MHKVLITDNLFVSPDHERQLRDAGIKVERLNKLSATEDELIEALQDKDAYIIGGVEQVSERVINSTKKLKVISLPGTAWDHYVPGWRAARAKGIKITNAPHANATAVAEWVFATGLAMQRDLFGLGRTGDKVFEPVKGFGEVHVGIVGLGHIGERLAQLFDAVGIKVTYWNRTNKATKFKQQNLDDLLKSADIVCFCVSSAAGKNFVNSEKLKLIKNGAIVNSLTEEITDQNALLGELKSKRIRAFLDWTPKDPGFKLLPVTDFYCSNEGTAFNTHSANKLADDIVVRSVINILNGNHDENIVNN